MIKKKTRRTSDALAAKQLAAKVISVSITDFGVKAMRIYANEVNLDRAVPDIVDGQKPVHRRILWAASQTPRTQFLKSARIVGDVMGKYHPHGDSSIYGGMTTMVQSCTPTLTGEGNWGNLLDPAAAMRYTNARLSNFGATGFDNDYANKQVTSFVPNYDDKDVEPVSIPYPLPLILLNGGSGIGYGTACTLPSFTPESVVEIIKRLLGGEKLKVIDFAKTMKAAQKWGGTVVNTKENRLAWMSMFTGSKASVLFKANLIVDALKKTIVIGEWPDGLNPEKFTEFVRAQPETQEVYPSKGSAEFTIVMKRGYNSVQFDAYLKKIEKKVQVRSSYNINVTRRTATIVDGVVDYSVELLAPSVPKLLMLWLKARIETETKSLEYRIGKQEAAIAYSELLIYAASKIDVIVRIVKTSKEPKADLSKALKINPEQADQILELKLRQLTKLDQAALHAKLKDQQLFLKQLHVWLKAPKKKMLIDTDVALQAIIDDREYAKKVRTQKLTMKKG